MTKKELIEMVGSEEQADYAMDIVLSQVKKEFVRSAIKSKLAEVEKQMEVLRAEGILYVANGTYHVNWNNDKERNKQNEGDSLIYLRNRLTSMLVVRG